MPDLYGHPFSYYSWKGQIALYEKSVDFIYHVVETGSDRNGTRWLHSGRSPNFPSWWDKGVC